MIRPRRLASGVELFPAQTPTLPPATHTNSYALGERDVLLVEPATPYDDEQAAWLEWARGIQSQGRTVVGIFVTHHHVDHASSAAYFARALGVPIFLHPVTARLLAHKLEGVTIELREEGASFRLHGHMTSEWNVLHTPGHAPGHLCLHDRDAKTIVVGDMVANGSTILVPPDDGGDMGEYLTQLRRLDALSASTLLPAHGEPLDDPHAVLDHYVKHRLMREEKIRAANERLQTMLGRAPSLEELLPHAYDDAPVSIWPIARLSLESHLQKLRREGRA